jgi:hypothetical protein
LQERGEDIAIRGLFKRATNTILIDVRITNLDSPSTQAQDPKKVLVNTESAKRRKYQHICESPCESFHPFVASTDGMLAPEATKILQHLADLMANKQQQPLLSHHETSSTTHRHHISQSCPSLPPRIPKETPTTQLPICNPKPRRTQP